MNTRHKTSILLIDKDPDEANVITEYLDDSGIKYSLFHATTFFDGLDILQKNQIELVLLNINLPDCKGFRAISTYFDRVTNVPAIVITELNNDIIGNQAVKAGAQDFLIKSQTNSKLFGRAVRYALQRSKVQLKLEATAKELEINKSRFLEAQKMAHFGTWEMDLVSNEMVWSEEVHRIFSFHQGSVSPSLSDYLSYVHVKDRSMVEKFFENIVKDSKLHQLEHRILVDGTNPRHIAIQGKVQIEEATGKIFLVGSIQDITELKLSEKLIIEKNISNKTAKIQEEVLADLSFQIRTPLSSVVNLLFLLENTETSKQQNSYLRDLKTSVDDLGLSVNNLLNFSVMVSDNVKLEEEEFNIRDFLQGTRNVLAIKAGAASVALDFIASKNLPEKIITDPKKLTQILYNLLDNAIKFSKENTKVCVSAIAMELEKGKTKLVLKIQDEGVGMEPEKIAALLEADKLLEVPDQKEELNKKRQLGIAIASKLAKTMHGKLDISSTLGVGSLFTVELPVRLPRPTRLSERGRPETSLKILLVEDHFLNQIATKKVLTSWSEYVSVDIAENGMIGVEKFREFGYDLVLMDLQMPVMNGLDAAQKIRAFSDVPIIALTANSSKQEQDKCLEIGMNDYLSKPFKPKELYARIMNMLSLVAN